MFLSSATRGVIFSEEGDWNGVISFKTNSQNSLQPEYHRTYPRHGKIHICVAGSAETE